MQVNRLHITNGDAAANVITASRIGGDVLPWRDPMHHGPFPADLNLDAVSDVRARYLGPPPGQPGTLFDGFGPRNQRLQRAAYDDEVVLWFEHDLLDQLQILQLLDWFGSAGSSTAGLSLICIGAFPGIEPFRGLGQLNPQQMAGLFPNRQAVTPAQLQLAAVGWAAFRAPDPTVLQDFLQTDLSALPFLRAALLRHLQEYPWSQDGLSRSERQLLTLVAQGVAAPGELVARNMALESVLFEGDLRSFQHLAWLSQAPEPLLHCEPDGVFRPPSPDLSVERFRQQRLTLTATGRAVLDGQCHALAVRPRDEWLGGVHLRSSGAIWVWDPVTAVLQPWW